MYNTPLWPIKRLVSVTCDPFLVHTHMCVLAWMHTHILPTHDQGDTSWWETCGRYLSCVCVLQHMDPMCVCASVCIQNVTMFYLCAFTCVEVLWAVCTLHQVLLPVAYLNASIEFQFFSNSFLLQSLGEAAAEVT